MKNILYIGLFLLLFIVLSNILPLRLLYKQNNCRYSNGDGTFTYMEMNFQGDNFELGKEKFAEFKRRRGGDTVLYRISPKNVLHYWDYGLYIFSPKYKLPYRDWEEIEKKRKSSDDRTLFQDF